MNTEDLIAIVTPIHERLGAIGKLMDAHDTHVNRLRIIADKTHALLERGSVERTEWVQIANDHLEATIACYDDFVKIEALYADIAQGISDGVGKLGTS